MNTAFAELSRVLSNLQNGDKPNINPSINPRINPQTNQNDFANVHVNVVGNWSKKKGPSISVQIQEPSPLINNGDNERRLQSFNVYLTNDDNVESVNDYNDTLPDSVEGIYKYDFNIMNIHDLILKKFERRKKYKIKELNNKLRVEEEKIKTRQNIIERKKSLKIIENIKEEIDNIIHDKDKSDYVNKIKPLIDNYNLMGSLSKIISFANKKSSRKSFDPSDPLENNNNPSESNSNEQDDNDPLDSNNDNHFIDNIIDQVVNIISDAGTANNNSDSETDPDSDDDLPEDPTVQYKRQQLISDFIEIAKKYIEIDLIREIDRRNKCDFCDNDLDEDAMDENGIIVCNNCNNEKISVVRSRFFSDTGRTNNTGNNYEDRSNFEKVLMRFQGKQQDKPPNELYEKLEDYFRTNQLPKVMDKNGIPKYILSSQVRDSAVNEFGEKEGTSRNLMFKALKDTGNSIYYDHINLILQVIWDWTLPDISTIEDQIMDDYDKSQRVYEALPKDRKSSLNSQFRLYKHLKRLNYPCKRKDFRIPTTHDILEFHENTWAKICEILEWENL